MLNLLRSRLARPVMAAVATVALAFAFVAVSQPAEARFVVGIGVGVPFPAYYPPPYYAYPPAYYYPPPVVYAPPPVVYAPPVAPPIAANPASDPYTAANGQTCREYQTTVNVNGQPQQTHGTACLQPDGSWRIVN
jgi:hypothetical protein